MYPFFFHSSMSITYIVFPNIMTLPKWKKKKKVANSQDGKMKKGSLGKYVPKTQRSDKDRLKKASWFYPLDRTD